MKPSSVFLADFIYYSIWAVGLLFVLGPYYLMRIQHAPEIWQWPTLALGFVLLVPAYWVLGIVRNNFPDIFEFIGAAHTYAKQRRDLSMEGKNLTALEYACFGILVILVVGVAVASSVMLTKVAGFGDGPFRKAAIIAAFAVNVVAVLPMLMTGARMSYYFGLRIAAWIRRA